MFGESVIKPYGLLICRPVETGIFWVDGGDGWVELYDIILSALTQNQVMTYAVR